MGSAVIIKKIEEGLMNIQKEMRPLLKGVRKADMPKIRQIQEIVDKIKDDLSYLGYNR